MTPEQAPVDPSRCPLCGESNNCGTERGVSSCWCFSVQIPSEVLERVPPEKVGCACVCEKCATKPTGQP